MLTSCDGDTKPKQEKGQEPPVEELYGGVAKVEAVRIAASKGRTAEDIAPYDEALAWHEYDVKKVLGGKLEGQRIRVAHWSVVRGKTILQDTTIGQQVEMTIKPFDEKVGSVEDVAVDDELDILAEEPPRYLDLKVVAEGGQTPEALRYDYGGHFSNQMQLYWKLRPQLRLVVLGNSHASRGIITSEMLDDKNKTFPEALNMAAGGADGYLQCLIAKEYVTPLPKLETIVWMVSARTFNKARRSNHRNEIFQASPAYDYDRKHWQELWPAPENPAGVKVNELEELKLVGADVWGWTGHDRMARNPGTLEEQEPALRKALTPVRYEFDEVLWEQFAQILKGFTDKGVRVFLVVSPIHPLSQDTPAADPDGSSREGLKNTVSRLEDLEKGNPMIWFHDTNRRGAHHFTHEQFYDADHLNKVGATQFTAWMKDWIQRVEKLGPRPPVTPAQSP
ncbi:hypothetical protein FEM03_05425 [Phragmitibacter flavus]|uniref:Uncharacterized protein n=2 Tax=Phragmitibacter flavus TaxID=2576071 RepID=A0A5R8KHX9_9BACT|nr:hypothetical protein FEM03_05425 [Phragmitibacter flavus]